MESKNDNKAIKALCIYIISIVILFLLLVYIPIIFGYRLHD